MEELVAQVRKVHEETGRDVREILESMRDEGYIQCGDDEFESCVEKAGVQR